MNGKVLYLALAVLLSACTEDLFDGPDQFGDDIEQAFSLDDLLPEDESRWSFTQITREENELEVDTTFGHNSSHSLRFQALASSNETVSKCSIAKQFMAFWEGETFHMSAWYFIEGTAKADYLFIFDIEEKTAIGAGPGMRLALVGDSGVLEVEHKYNNPNIQQQSGQEIPFPRNRWVHVEMETLLSKKEEGYVKVWQDGVLILEQYHWQTLPRDILYFQQGTKGMYSSIEFGITANTHDHDMVIYVDDVEVWTTQ